MVDVEDLYDEFAWGSPTPHAIRDFLARCRASWTRVPRFVLLLGDASIDPRGYLGDAAGDLVPTGRVDTAVLETASDDWLADFDDDGIPEIAIGRLPAGSAPSAVVMVAKVLGFSGTAAAGRVLLVADGNDSDNDFELATRRIAAELPDQQPQTLLLTGALGREQAQAALRQRLDEGAALVNFLGHASVTRWQRDLLNSASAGALDNPVRPVVLSMSCLTGFFHDPSEQSLAEALLAAANGGASAVWASSGLTGLQPQVGLAEMLLAALYPPTGSAPTLGEAIVSAKRMIQDVDARRTWILFGDPTMRLH